MLIRGIDAAGLRLQLCQEDTEGLKRLALPEDHRLPIRAEGDDRTYIRAKTVDTPVAPDTHDCAIEADCDQGLVQFLLQSYDLVICRPRRSCVAPPRTGKRRSHGLRRSLRILPADAAG